MIPPAATDNNRVTVAVLGEKIDNLIAEVRTDREQMREFIGKCDTTFTQLTTGAAVREQRLNELEDDIETLETNDKRWNLGLIIGTIVAGILGAIGIRT